MMCDSNLQKNILVVDDSALMRRVICDIINSDKTFRATDVCRDGEEAYEQIRKVRYDAIILDVNMPRMNGLELLEKLQQENIRATVIMVSTLTDNDTRTTLMAMELGAVDFVAKPGNIIEAKGEDFKRRLLTVLNTVISIRREHKPVSARVERVPAVSVRPVKKSVTGKKLVALACSTGGPKSLQSVIPKLDANLDAPVVLVQHMPSGFTKSMADRLDEISKVHVKEAEDGEVLRKGTVYVAPGGRHLKVKQTGDGHKIVLGTEPAVGGLRPCADIMYESLKGSGFDEIICVVLTGMGADGTKGIGSLKKTNPVYVISQDEASCVVYGMPRAVYEAGLVNEVVPLEQVAQSIMKNVGVK